MAGLFFLTFLYVLYMQLKTLRDYINMYSKGHPERWEDSVFNRDYPEWMKGYLLDDPERFIQGNPPFIFKFFVWNKDANSFKTTSIDGWHQLDGLMFLFPYWALVSVFIFVGIISTEWWMLILSYIIFPFFPLYWFFNLNYHVLSRVKNKEWHRIWPIGWFMKKK